MASYQAAAKLDSEQRKEARRSKPASREAARLLRSNTTGSSSVDLRNSPRSHELSSSQEHNSTGVASSLNAMDDYFMTPVASNKHMVSY